MRVMPIIKSAIVLQSPSSCLCLHSISPGDAMESSVYSGDLGFVSRIATACSFIYVCFKALVDSYHFSRPLLPDSTRPSREWQSSVRNLDGAEIFAFRAARTLGICGLIVLRWCQPLSRHNSDDSSVVYSHPALYVSEDVC